MVWSTELPIYLVVGIAGYSLSPLECRRRLAPGIAQARQSWQSSFLPTLDSLALARNADYA